MPVQAGSVHFAITCAMPSKVGNANLNRGSADADRVWDSSHTSQHPGGAVQVEHIGLTPRVESARFQLLESTVISSHWFQMSTCHHYSVDPAC